MRRGRRAGDALSPRAALVVYAVDDPGDGPIHFPTQRAAVRHARAICAAYRQRHDDSAAALVAVSRVTIPGPFNRDLVCRLLSYGGYAGEIAQVWPTPNGRGGNQ